RNAERLVEQIDNRQLVALLLVLHFRECRDEENQNQRAQEQRHQASPASQSAQAAEAKPPHDGQQRQQHQVPGIIEDEHRAPSRPNVCSSASASRPNLPVPTRPPSARLSLPISTKTLNVFTPIAVP